MVAAPADSFDNRKDVLNLLFGFNGRIDRQWWWLATLSIVAFRIAIGDFDMSNVNPAPVNASLASVMFHTNRTTLSFLDLLGLWTTFALDVKRWHDLNKSGFYALLSSAYAPLILISVGFQLGGPLGQPNVFDFLCVGATALGILSIFVLGFSPGTRGLNTYGDG